MLDLPQSHPLTEYAKKQGLVLLTKLISKFGLNSIDTITKFSIKLVLFISIVNYPFC